MRCRSCGQTFPDGETHCPECGAEVDFIHTSDVPSNLGIPSGMAADGGSDSFSPNNMSNFSNIPSGMLADNNSSINNFNNNSSMNSFNNNMSSMNNMDNFNGTNTNDQFNNQNKGQNDNNIPAGMKTAFLNDFTTKIPWIPIAIGLVVIMIAGLLLVPVLKKDDIKLYEGDRYALKYDASSWTLDEQSKDMILNYEDNVSKFVLNGIVTYSSLQYEVNSPETRKVLYDTLYGAWSNLEDCSLTGKGTGTFEDLKNGSMYARINYEMKSSNNIGAFYIIVSKDYDMVITYSLLCTRDRYDEIDADIMEMLNTMSFKAGSISSSTSINDYTNFRVLSSNVYENLGYMKYSVPDCWNYDDARSSVDQYKTLVFTFTDSVAELNVKAMTAYDNTTSTIGTNYAKVKADVASMYGAIKEESSIVVNDKVWYILITPDYKKGNESYHNEVYFTLSNGNSHLYYLEVNVPSTYNSDKIDYLRNSVEYILKSAELLKVNE